MAGSRKERDLPRVSVVMPVYNGGAYVEEAVRSVLGQGFGDFELIAIDDGSTDGSGGILTGLGEEDGRMRVVRRENRGLVASLNEGIGMATGEFVARMDADDVCLPERLGRQVDFLDGEKEVAVVGSWMEGIGAEFGRRWEHPADAAVVESALVFRSALAHPTVMMRRSLFSEEGFRYDPTARHVEDLALWMSVAGRHRLANVPEVLLKYRVHAGQVSAVYSAEQERRAAGLMVGFIRERLGIEVTAREAELHGKLAFSRLERGREFVEAADGWLLKLAGENERVGAFAREAFLRTLVGRCVSVHRFSEERGVKGGGVPAVFLPYVLQ